MSARAGWKMGLVAAILGVHCQTGGGGGPADPGALFVAVESPSLRGTRFENLSSINLQVTRIDVVLRSVQTDPSTERVVTVLSASQPTRFSGLAAGVPRVVARFQVEPGFVAQIRFVVAQAGAQFGGTLTPLEIERDVTLPSGAETGIKVIPAPGFLPFPIEDRGRTYIKVTYDPNDQILDNPGRGLILKPVFRAALVARRDLESVARDEIVVKFRNGVTRAQIDAFNQAHGTTIMPERIGLGTPANYFHLRLPPGLSVQDALIAYHVSDIIQFATPQSFGTTQAVPDDPLFAGGGPENGQWYLLNNGGPGARLGADLHVARSGEAWETTTGSHAVVVAVVDTGCDLSNPDLAKNLFLNEGENPDPSIFMDVDGDGLLTFLDLNGLPYFNPAACTMSPCFHSVRDIVADSNCNCVIDGEDVLEPYVAGSPSGLADGVNNDAASGNLFRDDLVGANFATADAALQNRPDDDDTMLWHGTHSCSLVGAVGDNATLMTGVNWSVRLLPVKAADSAGMTDFDTTFRAMSYAASLGADVVVIPLGPAMPEDFAAIDDFADGFNLWNLWRGNSALLLTELGDPTHALFVWSAGNTLTDISPMSMMDSWGEVQGIGVRMIVGGTDMKDQRWIGSALIGSDFGAAGGFPNPPNIPEVVIGAPAFNVRALADDAAANPFVDLDGTSNSAPLVGGVAALVLAARPGLSDPRSLYCAIVNGAESFPAALGTSFQRGRRVNATGALAGSLACGPTCATPCVPPRTCAFPGGCMCPADTVDPAHSVDCGTSCTSLLTDSLNCGLCGVGVPIGGSCVNGAWTCPPSQPAVCTNDLGFAVCSDLTSDPAHCGMCRNSCGPNQTCVQRTCVCQPLFLDCGEGCMDPSADPINCGACGVVCPFGGSCVGGRCVCPPGQVDCNGFCTDPFSDPMNCGTCGNVCQEMIANSVCSVADCVCPPGLPDVCSTGLPAPAIQCTNLLVNDPSNCGGCGIACPSGFGCCNALCTDFSDPLTCGSCETMCGPLDTCCPTVDTMAFCADLSRDPSFCGDCATDCHAVPGVVTPGCCDVPPTCTDLDSDLNNCGTCGTACSGSEVCCNGRCADTATDDGCCGASHTDCNDPTLGLAVPGCCGSSCVDLDTTSNCGTCGVACASGQSCCGGRCVRDASNCGGCGVACGSGQTCCSTGCTNTLTDPRHCGGCEPASRWDCTVFPGPTFTVCCGGTHCCQAGHLCCDVVSGGCCNLGAIRCDPAPRGCVY